MRNVGAKGQTSDSRETKYWEEGGKNRIKYMVINFLSILKSISCLTKLRSQMSQVREVHVLKGTFGDLQPFQVDL